jgi:ferredoxin
MRELPSLDESKCTACGDCVSVCPTRCLERQTTRVWMPRPRDCITCEVCVKVCPESALEMREWVPA